MKTINLNLNKAEKAIKDTVIRAYKNEMDLPDHLGMISKEFIKLRKYLEDCIIMKEPIKNVRLEDL